MLALKSNELVFSELSNWLFGALKSNKEKLMKLERWLSGVLLCASLLLGTSCERLKEAVSGSESEEVSEEKELGEAYVFAVREPEYAKGFTITSTTRMLAPDVEAEVKVGQKTVEGTMVMTVASRSVVQVLSKDLGRLTVQLEKSTHEFRMTGGPTNSEVTKGPLVGQYVLLEKTDGVWAARFESGKAPNAEERKAMDVWVASMNEVSEGPEKEVRRIGEEWEEDTELLGMGKAQLRFERIEDYQGLRCAVIVGTVKFSEKTPDGGNHVFEGTVRTYRSLDHYQDLYSEMNGVVTGTAYPQLGLTVRMNGPFKLTTTTVLSNPTAEAAAKAAAEAAARAVEEAAKAAEVAEAAARAVEEAAKAAEVAEAAAEEAESAEDPLGEVVAEPVVEPVAEPAAE